MRELRLIIAHTIVEELRLQKPDLQEIDNGTGECWLPGGCTPQSAGCVVNIFDIAEAVEREVREALRTTEQHSQPTPEGREERS